MSTAFESDGWGGGSQPSVSKDKWVRFAVQKMERGYALIVSEARKSACFFMSGKGYEGCSFKVARQLMIDGILVESGNHPLGKIYLLDPEALARLTAPVPKTPFHIKMKFDVEPPARVPRKKTTRSDDDPGHLPDTYDELPGTDEMPGH